MKTNVLKLSLYSLIALLISVGCKKEPPVEESNHSGNTTTGSTPQSFDPLINPGPSIYGSVSGIVRDANGIGLDNVSITVGSETVTTNQFGAFFVHDIQLGSHRTIITAEKTGYFNTSRGIVPNTGKNAVIIEMTPRIIAGTINNDNGGSINLGVATINFDAGDIANANGTPYSGPFTVYASSLDPNDPSTFYRMPGDLRAINANNEEQVLQSFGMVAVELVGGSGQSLNVAQGETVEIIMDLSGPLQANANQTIPMWYYDEVGQAWVEDGAATLSGSQYIAEVSHFTWWNFDRPYPGVQFTVAFECNGQSLQGFHAKLVDNTSFTYNAVPLNSDGSLQEIVPAGPDLSLDIIDNNGVTVGTLPLGVLSIDTHLGIRPLCGNGVSLTGKLTNCAGSGLSNGYLLASTNPAFINSFMINGDQNGDFDTQVSYAGEDSLYYRAIDMVSGDIGLIRSEPMQNQILIGDISTCDSSDYYLEYTMDGVHRRIDDLDPNSNLVIHTDVCLNMTRIVADPSTAVAEDQFSVYVAGYGVGQYQSIGDSTYFSGCSATPPTNFSGIYIGGIRSADNETITITYTAVGIANNTFAKGHFSGSFIEKGTNITHTISGEFRLPKP